MAISSRSSTHLEPSALEDLARRLAGVGASRAVVELVEKWAEVDEPTPAAWIAQARAFMDLRLVDRAWSRLRALIEVPAPRREAVLTAIELFLLREWHERARKLAAWALLKDPHDPLLRSMHDRAVEPATTVDPPQVDPDGLALADLVRAAELHMAHGAFIKARSLLERARRRAPHNERVQDLLWALAGDFSVPGPLGALFESLSARSITAEETEQTEYVRSNRPRQPKQKLVRLFREGAAPKPLSPNRAELSPPGAARLVTPDQATAVSALSDLAAIPFRVPVTDGTDSGDDTQIARVVLRAPRATAEEQHTDGPRARVDGEAEDDSIIVHTPQVHPERVRSRDPLHAAQAEADRERQANQWRKEDTPWSRTEPRVARDSFREPTERLDWTPDEEQWFERRLSGTWPTWAVVGGTAAGVFLVVSGSLLTILAMWWA